MGAEIEVDPVSGAGVKDGLGFGVDTGSCAGSVDCTGGVYVGGMYVVAAGYPGVEDDMGEYEVTNVYGTVDGAGSPVSGVTVVVDW